ncbi:hypothetical protein BDA99DRAFT_70499 [Phascolomyces articulosus]|uniref:Replication factor A protein 2 n=1 Tax=Phascolomyces articulosus TaxID=60185 RepID=A0AAD5JZR7_9FUNG|nr:hypothetical protein BDA99DRAFT_70499 [Phascolomyces articulosus]
MDGGGGNSSGRKPMGEQTLRPVTLKQLGNCQITQEGTFRIDNADVTQITFVGVIRGITELSTNIQYKIEDGTGQVDVRHWIDQTETAEDAQKRADLVEDLYVRVFGRLNNFNNRVSVVAHNIRPIKDFNEINYHFIDTTLTHVKFTNTEGAGNSDDAMMIDSGAGAPSALGNALHDKIIDIIKEYHELEEGASVHQIISRLGNSVNETDIRNSIEYLINEGHCYTTVDDEHIKSTEAF